MDLHKLRILKFDDNSNKNAASREGCDETITYNDKSRDPINVAPDPARVDKIANFVSSGRISRPRKRKSFCKQRKSESDVSMSSQIKLKKHTRKRTLSLSDVTKTFKNSMNCNPIKHAFDLLSGDSELHIKKNRRHKKKRKRHNKIKKDIKIMFICETPRTSRKSRKRTYKYERKDNSSHLRSSDDIFGFQKRNRTLSQYLYNANCNYFNTMRKFKMGLHRKKKCSELEPLRDKHTRVRILSSDYLTSIESSLKHYSIVNTRRTNNGQCVKLHSHTERKTENSLNRPNINERVPIAPSSFAKLGKTFYNSSMGTMKSCRTKHSRSNGTRCQYHGIRNQQKGLRRVSHDAQCPIHGTSHSLHEDAQLLQGSACICTQCPSNSNVAATKLRTSKINQSTINKKDERRCGTKSCIKNQYNRLYARVLEKITTLYARPQTVAKNVVKYAFLGLLIIIWCPCVFVIGLAWIVTYPLKLQHVTTVDKTKKSSTIFSMFGKFRKNHRGPENQRIFNENSPYPKRKGFLSWLSNWSSRMADNIAKSIDTLMSIFKMNKNKSVSESSLCAQKHPNPEQKYSLFYQDNRGWIMKPIRSQEVSTLYHRNQVVQNVSHGCRFDAIRQKLARKKKYKEQQGSSLFRSPPANKIETMPICRGTKPVRPQTVPPNQVIILPPVHNPNSRHTRNSIYTAKKSQTVNRKHKAGASHQPHEIHSKEPPNRNSDGVHRNGHSQQKRTKSTRCISKQNVVLSRQYPAYAFANKYKPHSNPYYFPNQRTKLLTNQHHAQTSTHQSGLKVLYKSMNTELNIPSVSLQSSCDKLLDNPSTRLSKQILCQPSKTSLNSLSSRHVNLKHVPYQMCLDKLQCTVDKLSKYLEQTKLSNRCLNDKNVQGSRRLEYDRKQQSSKSSSSSRFEGPVSRTSCKCSGDNNLSCPNKHTCLDRKNNYNLKKGVNEQPPKLSSEQLQGRNEEECSCLSYRKKNTDNKSSHHVIETGSRKHFTRTGSKNYLETTLDKYSPEKLSSKDTRRPSKNIARFIRETVGKLHMKNKNIGSSNICSCLADLKESEDNLDKQVKKKIDDITVECPYCKRIMKRNRVECECSKDFLHLKSKRKNPVGPGKNQRSGAMCKCQIVKQKRVSEKPRLLPHYSFFKKKSNEKNSIYEGRVKKPNKRISSQQNSDHAISKNNKRICKCPSKLPISSPSSDLILKKPTNKNDIICECPPISNLKGLKSQSNKPAAKNTKGSSLLCDCPKGKLQFLPRYGENNLECECTLRRQFNHSQSQSNKRASKKVNERERGVCECPAEKPQFVPTYGKNNIECECPLHRSQPNKLASKKVKRIGSPCECSTEKPTFRPSNNKNSLVCKCPRHRAVADSPPRLYKAASEKTKGGHTLCDCSKDKQQFIPHDVQPSGKNKVKRNSVFCECKNSQFQPDKRALTHDDSRVESWDCECPSEEAQRVAQIPRNKEQLKTNNKLCSCKVNSSRLEHFTLPSENVEKKGVVWPMTRFQVSSHTLLVDKSPPKPARGLHVKCTCSGEYSTLQTHPNDKIPLLSHKADKVSPKSLRAKEVKNTSQPPFTSHMHGEQSNHSIKSDRKMNLKRSFEKLHLKLARYFSSDLQCTCSSEKDLSDTISKLTHPNFGKNIATTKTLPKTSSKNKQATNSREKVGYLQKSANKIHSKLSPHALNHMECMCSGDKIKPLYDKESDVSVKSRNGSSQRVRFEPLEILQNPHDPHQPKTVNSNKHPRPNDTTQPIPDSKSYHPLKLKSGKINIISSKHSNLSQRASSSSKEKITNALRNTIDKLHSMLGRYVSSNTECMCPESDQSYSDSQYPVVADRTRKKKSKLAVNKGFTCSCRHDKALVEKPNNGLFQYPSRQQAISPVKQRSSTGQVTTTKCPCSNAVQHRYVESPSHPIHRTHAMSTQWIQPANDPCRLPPRCHTPSAQPLPRQPVLRSRHCLPPQVLNVCTPTCISKRRKPRPPGTRLSYPTVIPDPLCRRYAVNKQVIKHPESKRKRAKRRSFGKIFCTYCTKVQRAIVNADADMWPKNFHCDGRMYVHTLRKKPCYCLFKCCPSMYPCFLTACSLAKSFCTTILYIVAIICWSPFLCCFCLLCEDLCCCLRRR